MNNSSWEKAHQWYDSLVKEKGHYYHESIILPSLLKALPKKTTTVIDFGCGQGILSRMLPSEIEYFGIDLSSSLIKKAKELAKHKNQKFYVGDVCKTLPLEKKDFFDCGFFILSLQNMSHPMNALKTASYHLKKGGTLIIVLNHPSFRIPRQSSWGIDEKQKIQYRRVNSYMTPLEVPIQAHPSKKEESSVLYSYHYPLSSYSQWLFENGFTIERIEELVSNKKSTGSKAKMENKARQEFPLFLSLFARKT